MIKMSLIYDDEGQHKSTLASLLQGKFWVVNENRSRNTKSMTQFARYYILNKLRKHSQSKVADRLSSPEDAVEDDLHNMFHAIANQLANEKEQQFVDMLYNLELTSQNLS